MFIGTPDLPFYAGLGDVVTFKTWSAFTLTDHLIR